MGEAPICRGKGISRRSGRGRGIAGRNLMYGRGIAGPVWADDRLPIVPANVVDHAFIGNATPLRSAPRIGRIGPHSSIVTAKIKMLIQGPFEGVVNDVLPDGAQLFFQAVHTFVVIALPHLAPHHPAHLVKASRAHRFVVRRGLRPTSRPRGVDRCR